MNQLLSYFYKKSSYLNSEWITPMNSNKHFGLFILQMVWEYLVGKFNYFLVGEEDWSNLSLVLFQQSNFGFVLIFFEGKRSGSMQNLQFLKDKFEVGNCLLLECFFLILNSSD